MLAGAFAGVPASWGGRVNRGEQKGGLHVFSVGPSGATHQDMLLTMSATAFQAYRRHMDTR
jgi:hypothetical protein